MQRGGNAAEVAARAEQLFQEQTAKTAIDLQRNVNENQRRIELINLEASMQGRTSEEIASQITMLQARQELQRRGVDLTSEEARNYMASAEALALANARAATLSRESQRVADMWRSLASTIENSLGQVFDDLFSGKRITDWGAQLKSIIGQVVGELARATVIRPLIGTALETVGAPASVTQQYGTFGSLFSSPSSALSTVSNAASLTNTVSGGGGLFSSTGMLSGVGNFLNTSIGPSLGFAMPGAPFSATVAGPSFLGATGSAAPLGTGLFGSATLTSVIPYVGLAIGAGMLLSQLFGNKKPPNQSAGGMLDLTSGQITSGFAGGNSQIDQQTQQVVTSVAAITEALVNAGGTLSGNLLIQGGRNTGFTVDSTLPGFTGRFELGKDPMAAIQMIGLALTQSVEGASETVQTILAQTTDLNQLTENLAFAQVYDNISTAVEESFANIEDATKRAGPFDIAMQQITATFDEITRRATEFGLALEPVNAALAEATRRLQEDFRVALETTFNTATGKDYINQAQLAYDQFVANYAEAGALGLRDDPEIIAQNTAAYRATLEQIFAPLSADQLREVQAAFGGIDLDLTDLTNTMIAAAEATGKVAAEMQSLANLAESLTIGEASGLTGAAAVQAQQQEFLSTQAAVAPGTQTYDDLAAAGNALIQASMQAYGNGPQTEALRQEILSIINPILAGVPGFASGTTSTPPGPILVGEQGPEIITQPGGLQVFNNADTMRILAAMPGRHFAEGTNVVPFPAMSGRHEVDNATRIDRLLAAPQMRPLAPANDQGRSAQAVDVVAELRELRAENAALRASVTELLDRGNNIALRVGHEITLRQDRQLDADTAPAIVPPVRRVVNGR